MRGLPSWKKREWDFAGDGPSPSHTRTITYGYQKAWNAWDQISNRSAQIPQELLSADRERRKRKTFTTTLLGWKKLQKKLTNWLESYGACFRKRVLSLSFILQTISRCFSGMRKKTKLLIPILLYSIG